MTEHARDIRRRAKERGEDLGNKELCLKDNRSSTHTDRAPCASDIVHHQVPSDVCAVILQLFFILKG